SLPNVASDLAVSGTGTVNLVTGRDITLVSGAHITTVNGDITLSANQQASPTSGNFVGININGGVIETSGTGKITLLGRGGDDPATSQHYGVWVKNNAVVDSLERPSPGSITIVGTGGTASDDSAGVRIDSAQISTGHSDISITGIATATSGSLEDG